MEWIKINNNKKNKKKTSMSKIVLNENIINYDKTRKLANYSNRNYAYCRESMMILLNKKACNNMEHFAIDEKWQQLLQKEWLHKWRTGNFNLYVIFRGFK